MASTGSCLELLGNVGTRFSPYRRCSDTEGSTVFRFALCGTAPSEGADQRSRELRNGLHGVRPEGLRPGVHIEL